MWTVFFSIKSILKGFASCESPASAPGVIVTYAIGKKDPIPRFGTDFQTAPAVDRCPRCGGEIYQREELVRWGGCCGDCAAELRRAALGEPGPQTLEGG